MCWVIKNLLRCAFLGDDTTVQEHHPVGNLPGKSHLVGDYYHRVACLGKRLHYLEDLADSSAVEIAKNHLIEDAIKTIDVGNGSYPKSTMNHRETELKTKNDENGHIYLLLNDKVRILENDLEKENGYVNVIDKVLAPSKALAFKQVGKHASFSLFYQALEATGLNKIIEEHEIDPGYDPEVIGPHFSHKSQHGKTVYPPTRFQKFTILVESDDLLADPTKKMSKSDENPKGCVYILDEPNVIIKKFKSAVTDSDMEVAYREGKDGINNLMTIYGAVTGFSMDSIQRDFEGKGYGDFKKAVGEAVAEHLAPVRENYSRYLSEKAYLEDCYRKGAEQAERIAQRTIDKMYKKVGFVAR